MSITLNLPPILERKLSEKAALLGIPISDYVMRILSSMPLSEKTPQLLPYGKYRGPNPSVEEDFKIAEWRLDDEDVHGE